MKSRQAQEDFVDIDGKKVRRDRVVYGMREIDQTGDGSKVLDTVSGMLYGRDGKTGTLLRMDRLSENPPVKGKAAKKAAKREKRRAS